jgi:hypothetical protein
MGPPLEMNSESSSAGAAPQTSDEAPQWDPSLMLGLSDEIMPSLSYAQQPQSSTSYGGPGEPPRYRGPAGAIEAATTARKREGHERKRIKVNSDAATGIESADYWIHLDDDELDNRLGGSFEIDFSRPRDETISLPRWVDSRER